MNEGHCFRCVYRLYDCLLSNRFIAFRLFIRLFLSKTCYIMSDKFTGCNATNEISKGRFFPSCVSLRRLIVRVANFLPRFMIAHVDRYVNEELFSNKMRLPYLFSSEVRFYFILVIKFVVIQR